MLGVVRQIEGNANGRILLRKYYALALLPPEMIIPAFESLPGDDGDLNNIFGRLHDYVRRQWINRVNPEHFSVFKQRHRTNNVMESYHWRLYSKLVRHPGVWDLIETLIDIQNMASIELAQLERSGRVFRVAKKSVIFHARLEEAWNKLDDGWYNSVDFLRQAVHFVEGLDRQLYEWNEDDGDEDDPVPALMPLNPDNLVQNPLQLQPLPEHPPAHIARPIPNEPPSPPPLHFFLPQPQAALAEPPSPSPELQEDRPVPDIHQVFPQAPFPREPPPLIFFNAEPPVTFAEHATPLPDLPVHPPPDPPSPPPNYPSPLPYLSTGSIEALSPESPPSWKIICRAQ